MHNRENPVNKLHRHIKKHGTKGLLPQNLTDDLLRRMNLEAEAIRNGTTEEVPSSTMLLSILHLVNPAFNTNKMVEVEIEPDVLMEYFDLFMVALSVEDMRRKKEIKMDESSLPTLQNIFDLDRKIEITKLK